MGEAILDSEERIFGKADLSHFEFLNKKILCSIH